MSIVTVLLPKYEVTLPITKKKIQYRPFTVREEKILLLALEEGNVNAYIQSIGQIIDECTFHVCSIDTLNKVDAEYLFISIRNKSLGEGVEVNGICKECNERTPLTLNLENIKVRNVNKEFSIQFSDDLWVTMKLPSMKDSLSIGENDGDAAIAACLDTIISGENSYNASEFSLEMRAEFIDSLSPLQKMKFKPFFESFPVVEFDHDYLCSKCGKDNHIHINGVERFFV